MRLLLVLLLCCGTLACRRKRPEVPVAATPPIEEAPSATASGPSPHPAPPATASFKSLGSHPGEPANPKEVRAAYHQYFAKIGSFPNSWEDMIKHKVIPSHPLGKNGKPLDFVQFTYWEARHVSK